MGRFQIDTAGGVACSGSDRGGVFGHGFDGGWACGKGGAGRKKEEGVSWCTFQG
jgi:hypothetical protein